MRHMRMRVWNSLTHLRCNTDEVAGIIEHARRYLRKRGFSNGDAGLATEDDPALPFAVQYNKYSNGCRGITSSW
jgi:hypothetical protein